ncbi:hypothetical protein AB4114_27645 [Paenibacillus sp. 2RAB27]|jgi:hypothetical protein|nr:hypothetical protein [Paenibacillus sp. Soil750]
MDKFWHSFWLRFNEVILDSCICDVERTKIFNKISYHRTKLYT